MPDITTDVQGAADSLRNASKMVKALLAYEASVTMTETTDQPWFIIETMPNGDITILGAEDGGPFEAAEAREVAQLIEDMADGALGPDHDYRWDVAPMVAYR